MTSEHALLARIRRFVTDPAARGLADDVAVLGDLVLTHDSIAEGVHYLPHDPPASVGWKLVAVNLSDLAAKGAEPVGALLSLAIAGDSDGTWEEAFLSGVEAACESYGLPLIGGDTIALPLRAPRVLGLTAIGRAGTAVPARSGARPGDHLWVVGTLGDAAAGLAQLLIEPTATGLLVEAFRRPVPQLAVGRLLAPLATASMDVSDGLLIDLQRLCRASGCGAHVELADVPISQPFRAVRGDGREARLFAATGGDDYAILAALPAALDPFTLSLPAGAILARIGTLVPGDAVSLTFEGTSCPLPERLGHEHRASPA